MEKAILERVQNINTVEKISHDDFFKNYLNEIRSTETDTYLGNMPIAKMFPELLDHVDFSLISNVRNSTSLWIGPPGTLTGWHTDRLANNILALIERRKLVFLVNPKDSNDIYSNEKHKLSSRLSDVNMEDFNESKHPSSKDVNVPVYYNQSR